MSAVEPNAFEQPTKELFYELLSKLGGRSHVELPTGGSIDAPTGGKLPSVLIKHAGETVDLCEMPDSVVDGQVTYQKAAGHDSEVDTIPMRKPFPRDQEDIQKLGSIIHLIPAA